MNDCLQNLYELADIHEDLPVLALVHSDMIRRKAYNIGSLSKARVTKVIQGDYGWYEYTDNLDTEMLFEFIPEWEGMNDETLREAYDNLNWIKCLIVEIDTPEV